MEPGERIAVLVHRQWRLGCLHRVRAVRRVGAPPERSEAPTAAIQFAHDIGIPCQSTDANTIVRWTDVNRRGGHFAALEEPELLINDIRDFLRSLRPN